MKKYLFLILALVLTSCSSWASDKFKNEAFYSFDKDTSSVIEIISYDNATKEEVEEYWKKVLRSTKNNVWYYFYPKGEQDRYYLFLEHANWSPTFSSAQMFIEEKRDEYSYDYIATKILDWEYIFADCTIDWNCD